MLLGLAVPECLSTHRLTLTHAAFESSKSCLYSVCLEVEAMPFQQFPARDLYWH